MTRAPFVAAKPSAAFPRGEQTLYDTTLGWRFTNPRLADVYYPYSMGETAENVVERCGVSREEQDAFALASQQRWAEAQEAGRFADEVVPISTPASTSGPAVDVAVDEPPRPDTTLEKLAALTPRPEVRLLLYHAGPARRLASASGGSRRLPGPIRAFMFPTNRPRFDRGVRHFCSIGDAPADETSAVPRDDLIREPLEEFERELGPVPDQPLEAFAPHDEKLCLGDSDRGGRTWRVPEQRHLPQQLPFLH